MKNKDLDKKYLSVLRDKIALSVLQSILNHWSLHNEIDLDDTVSMSYDCEKAYEIADLMIKARCNEKS